MSDWSDAFAEVFRAVQPDVEPKLTYGEGDEPDPDAELDSIILNSVRVKVWESGLEVRYGDRVVPTVGNGRRYKVTVGGTLDSSEPSWPGEFGSVETNGVRLEEDGYFVGNVYDVRAAIFEGLKLRYAKDQLVDFSGDGRSVRGSQRSARIKELMQMYRPVGIA